MNKQYLAIGGLIYGVMSALWLVIAYLLNSINIWVITAISSAILSLCMASMLSLKKSKNLLSNSENSKELGKWFGIVFSAEGILIGAGSGFLAATNRIDWIVPWVALIVALHFFPLRYFLKLKMMKIVNLWEIDAYQNMESGIHDGKKPP